MTRNIAKLGDFIEPAPVVKCGDAEYPVLSMTMHEGIMLQSDRFKKSLASVDKNNYKVVEKGQLVIGFPIDEGVLYIQNVVKAGIMSPAYNVWNIKKDKINPIFLEYCLHSPQAMNFYKSNLRGSTARRRTIPSETLLNLPIPNVSFLEQENAISNITEVKTLINLANKQLDLLDQLVKSRFVEMFGDPYYNSNKWETKPFLELGDCKNGMNFNSQERGIEIRYVGVGDFQNRVFITNKDNLSCVSLNQMPNEEYLLKDEDILFVRSNGSKELVGRCVVVCPNNEPITYSGFCIRWRKKTDKVLITFLIHLLKHESTRAKFSGRGANIQNINQKMLQELDIILPPLALQNQFADFVQQVDKAKASIKKSLEQLETLKKKLMQDYFG